MTKGLVSVTIPFRNSRQFLSESIESVLGQTYSDWELLLVDDGAEDGSSQIALEYSRSHHEKVQYIEHPAHANRGVTCARNVGAAQGSVQFLAFLDSDDVWLPHKLEHQVALLESQPAAGIVYGPSEYWYDWNPAESKGQKNLIQFVAPAGRTYDPPFLFMNSHPLGRYGAPCPSSLLIRRTTFDQIGGFVEDFNPKTWQLYEDTAFLSKIYLETTVLITDICCDKYRRHPGSIWEQTVGTTREERERKFFFAWLAQYLQDKGIADPAIRRAVRRQSWMYDLQLTPQCTRFLRRVMNRWSS